MMGRIILVACSTAVCSATCHRYSASRLSSRSGVQIRITYRVNEGCQMVWELRDFATRGTAPF